MKLEIGKFHVKKVLFGERTHFEAGILTINEEEAIVALNPDGELKNVRIQIACPGESVRILPVKDIVEARVRPDGRAVFPGVTGPVAPCGEGKLYALKGMSVMAVGKYGGWSEGILDMSGPGAELTYYSDLIHVCFVAENTDPQIDQGQHMNLNYRKGAKLLAEYLGKTVKDQRSRKSGQGIKCVAVFDEDSGRNGRNDPSRVVLDSRCDAIVSKSNEAQIVELLPMERIIGDLESVNRDVYPGIWADNPEYGPSLRPDGSIIMDTSCLTENSQAWSTKTCKNF